MGDRLIIASDHGGVDLKRELVEGLKELRITIDDVGAHSAEACDYADYAHDVARAVASGKYTKGLLLCGTGVGMAISANRHKGIRAVNCSDTFSARYSRQHNDANVLCLGARVVGFGLAWDIVNVWLATDFSGDARRMSRRVAKIDAV